MPAACTTCSATLAAALEFPVVNTIVSRHQQLHRNELAGSIDPARVSVRGSLQGIQSYLTSQGSSPAGAVRKVTLLSN